MTQTAIVSTLAEKTGLKKSEVKSVIDAITELATVEVKKNGEFTVPGFGKLKKTNRKAREGRNPATGAIIKIPAKTTVKFSVGKAMHPLLTAGLAIGGGLAVAALWKSFGRNRVHTDDIRRINRRNVDDSFSRAFNENSAGGF